MCLSCRHDEQALLEYIDMFLVCSKEYSSLHVVPDKAPGSWVWVDAAMCLGDKKV
jgi:hypothetical protein